jgi:hypothetical protein
VWKLKHEKHFCLGVKQPEKPSQKCTAVRLALALGNKTGLKAAVIAVPGGGRDFPPKNKIQVLAWLEVYR